MTLSVFRCIIEGYELCKKEVSVRSQNQKISFRIARWANYVEEQMSVQCTSGYNMSGRWNDFYLSYLFPEKTLHVARLNGIIQRLRKLGYIASLEITPFEIGLGLYTYVKLRRVTYGGDDV